MLGLTEAKKLVVVELITRRSSVQIRPPQPTKSGHLAKTLGAFLFARCPDVDVRRRNGCQRLDQTSLCTRSKVRVHVCALLGSMPELRLHGLDGVPAGDCLACDRVTPEGVVTQGSKAKHARYCARRSFVAIDVAREGSVLAEQELRAGISLADMPSDGIDDVLGKVQDVRLVVLPGALGSRHGA